jgi:hypothetical protein
MIAFDPCLRTTEQKFQAKQDSLFQLADQMFFKKFFILNFNLMNHSENSRRSFIKKTAMGTAMLATEDFFKGDTKNAAFSSQPGNPLQWYRRITRWGQVNITEKDPPRYDIAWWRTYWKETETAGVIINAGGIVAYYPTRIPLHKKAAYLGDRDLFGELCHAAHEDGLAVFARMDSNRADETFYNAHPDWFATDAKGKPYRAGDLYITCINSPYYENHIPSILSEIAEMYKPEGFTDNSWSGLGRESICYCSWCRNSFRERTGNEIPSEKNWNDKVYRQWIKWNYARRLEIWDLNNKTTKAAGGEDCIWSGMNSGSITGQSRSFRDYRAIAKKAEIIMLDDQARTDNDGFQHNSEIGKLVHGILGWDKLIPESMAMYQAHKPWFRLASKPEPEARMWMLEGIAGGLQPWWHMISAYHEDRRMYHSPVRTFQWHKANEQYLLNRVPVANVGVIWSQDNSDFYGRDNASYLVDMPWRGITQALVRARIPYLPLHIDDIDHSAAQLKVLVLPNIAAMNDAQVTAIRRFVQNGGSVVATGETSLYNGWGEKRNDYALADIFGAHISNQANPIAQPAEKFAGEVYHTYLRLIPEMRAQVNGPHITGEPAIPGKRHAVLKGFEETDTIPFGGLLQPLNVDPHAEVLMTFIPQFPVYPPEKAYMTEPKTNIPGVIISTAPGGGRVVFLPADIDRQFSIGNLPDHGNLIKNIVLWTLQNELPVIVEGVGLLDIHLYEQKQNMILHIVNLTNQNTWKQPLDELIPVGPLHIKLKNRQRLKGEVRSLVSKKLTAQVSEEYISFDIASILDHEVIVVS